MADMNAAFDIDLAIPRLQAAVQPFPKAAMFALAELGHRSLFEQLIACIISIRTYDEVSLPVSVRLLQQANTPGAIAQLSTTEIGELIRESTFAETKAQQILEMAQRILTDFDGVLPADYSTLTSFKGVGPKCANLALGVALGHPCISVDVHVHRVTNRWGYVATRSPEQTLKALTARLPQRYWIQLNELLVPFGKHICTGDRPQCSQCPVQEMCQQVGVTHPR